MQRLLKILIITAGLLLVIGSSIIAADDSTFIGWKKSVLWDITTTQTAYSNSWVGGEAGSVNWVTNLNATAEKNLKTWLNFKSTLRTSFGQTLTQDEETRDWSKPKKSTDLIDFENIARFTLQKLIDPYAALRVETQFYDGSNPAKKLFLSPAKFTESVGGSRKFYERENDFVTSRLGLALRQIRRTVIVDSVLLTTTDSTLTDGGIESVSDATLSFHKNLRYVGKLTLYKAFFFSKSEEVKGTPYEDDWKAVDVNWENMLSAAVTKIVTVNLYTQLLYDKEVSKKGRIKETVAIGFVFKMI